MKQFYFLLLFFLFMCLQCTGSTFSRHGFRFTIKSDSTVGVTDYCRRNNTEQKIVMVPATVSRRGKLYKVTSLEPTAFCGCQFIESIILPESLTKICKESIILCSSLHSITIPASVCIIEDGAVFGNKSLEEIKADTLNPYFDSKNNCNAIIRKENNTLVIGCKKTIIPYGVQSIGPKAFYSCRELDSISIPSSVETIGINSFKDCKDIRTVLLQEGLKQIEDAAFEGCLQIDNISIPEGVTTIGKRAFGDCASLQTIIIPNSVVEIKEEAFSECLSLKKLFVYPSNVTYSSYDNCNVIVNKTNGTLVAGCSTSIIPDDVINIGTGAFKSCQGLDSIILPHGVKFISDEAFEDCVELTGIRFPHEVSFIGSSSFKGCSSLSSIKLPTKLEVIWCDAFNSCNNLFEIDIPENVWCIDAGAFMNCNSLKVINLPASITRIGNYAFWSCDELTDVHILSPTPPEIGEKAFSRFGTLHVKQGYKKFYKKKKYWKRFNIIDDL